MRRASKPICGRRRGTFPYLETTFWFLHSLGGIP